MMLTWQSAINVTLVPVAPENPWFSDNMVGSSLYEIPTPTVYLQRDGWFTMEITGGSVAERPTPTSYLYAPSNEWLLTDKITPSAVTERPTPTTYLKAD